MNPAGGGGEEAPIAPSVTESPEETPSTMPSLNPNASTFVFNPSVPVFEFKPSGGLGLQRLPSVSEDEISAPVVSPEQAAAAEDPAANDEADGTWDGDWQGEGGEWQGEWEDDSGQVWDEHGYYDENGSYNEYTFDDYLDSNGEYWADGQSMPVGMLGGAPWPRRGGGGHDRSHWHQSGTSSASTSPFTAATLQGANLQPWCGKLFLPTKGKEGEVQKYDTNFLMQFQNKCTTTPADLPSYLVQSAPMGAVGAGHRNANTPFKNKNRAPGSDRSTLMLDGMAQRSDLFNQQDLHIPQQKRTNVVTYNSDFLLKFQHMSGSIPDLPGFSLPDLPGITDDTMAVPNSPHHPAVPSLCTPIRSSKKSGKKPRGGSGAKVAHRSKFPNSVFSDHPEQRKVGPGSKGGPPASPWAKNAPVFSGPVEPLTQSENRWMRPSGEEADNLEKKQKVVLALLNKMTPEKFEKLLVKLLDIKITTKDVMSMVIGSIFDKAVAEPAYATMYAELCKRLSAATPQVEEHGEMHTFKRMLLKKCYDNFMNEAEEDEPELIEGEAQEEADERFSQAKKRMLGNVTLIGELFKKGLLTENIIKICITLLLEESLEDPDCRDIEALCLLVSIVGENLDMYVQTIMPQLDELAHSSLLPSRMRFMLENVIDLRKNSWVPRREKMVTPKKLKEVHAAPSMQRTSSYQSPFMKKKLGHPKGRAAKSPVNPMTRSFSDGHAAVMVDPTLVQNLRMRRKGQDPDESPGLGRTDSRERGFSEWEPGRQFELTSVTESPVPHKPVLPQNTSKGITEPPTGFGKPKAPTVNKSEPEPMDADLFEKKMCSILDEFLASSDQAEALECINELKAGEQLLTSVPTTSVLHVMERKPADRTKIDELLLFLCQKSVLSEEHAVGGMTSLMEQMPDMEMDVPMYGKYIATSMSVLLVNKCIKPSALKEIFADMLGTSHAPKVMLWVFDAVVTGHGLECAQQLYADMLVPALDFIPGEDKSDEEVQRWLAKVKCTNQLGWLFSSESPATE
eukprot:TRINITY_DN4390_c0_g7_i1.p1 TRINITY_DN4390_c0_g7~~TRINITY_DN4390_c0_g7_i1.p1  ORF type:complete len:1018 (+),score=286.17 TRINITY_DN4390_c0_g7_i1:196-3249(+)